MKYKCIKSYPWTEKWIILYKENIFYRVEDYPEYWQPIEEEKDYSEFIWYNSTYYIRWKKWYMYYDDWIHYANCLYNIHSFKPKTTTCLISELKIWDIVYIKDWEMKQEDFMIYVGKRNDNWYCFQQMKIENWIEYISPISYSNNQQVIKFIN